LLTAALFNQPAFAVMAEPSVLKHPTCLIVNTEALNAAALFANHLISLFLPLGNGNFYSARNIPGSRSIQRQPPSQKIFGGGYIAEGLSLTEVNSVLASAVPVMARQRLEEKRIKALLTIAAALFNERVVLDFY
jgi:hypothetical protein